MYLPISKRSRKSNRAKGARVKAALKARNRRRVNGAKRRPLGRRR